MDVRSYSLLVALAFAGTALTGCIEAPGFLNVSADEASAFENKAIAEEAALAWSQDALLVGVMAVELSESEDARVDADPDVGNGLAPAWWYVYAADTQDDAAIKAFKVAADGTLSSEDEAEEMAASYEHGVIEPLQAWNTDSDDAIAAAKTDATFRKAAEGFNATVVEGVAHTEGITSWWVSAMSADGFVVAMVDAATGELIEAESIDMDFEIPAFEWGAANPAMAVEPVHVEGEGELQNGEPVEYPFHVSAPMGGILQTEADGRTLPGMGGARWSILDNDGESVADGALRGEDEFELEIDEPGDYTLVLEYWSWTGSLPVPTGDGTEYAFILHLEPGYEFEDEEEE